MSNPLYNIAGLFNISSPAISIVRYGEGHIHDTYLVTTGSSQPDYILQKINHKIFRDIPGMMRNIKEVTDYLRFKNTGKSSTFSTPELVYTYEGQPFLELDEENFWRMYVYIPDTVTYQKMEDPALGFEAGKAIGRFQAGLAGLPVPLVETIPGFHDIFLRIEQYYSARENDPLSRKGKIMDTIDFAEKRFDTAKNYLLQLREKGVIRATHNDTKLNNILFSRQNEALCLIDLDTVMPGYVHFDFGDALRTMANTALEDEPDLKRVRFNEKVYQSVTKGFLAEAGPMLNEAEKELLPYAPVYMTFIIGLRFLADYLNGDTYFRIHHPDHNLDRARVQFKLVQEIEQFLKA
ncbi:MAG TPA: aminoglycoside phosphotransferase family protein [Bacteroidales bacterium]|nr:aminoglycoside phosphotransferase family protein [Bacteroidales bacterium]HOX76883.1 aminoglycoside phosphotransferase family protein [Bacteroidales bacterium]HPI85152.1 aminoglycoside phosphotransferase family protein [Bacteroidales bacterium]HPM91848.1 aminoglycoside phosphotransferase family protein [Bacteroidales bacterium]